MAFVIKCKACGTEQLLSESDMYDTESIGITVDPYNINHWDSVTIECKNPECENYV